MPDVLVIGGGVAGSSAARVLAELGYAVTIVERSEVFRDRVRGEGIHPWGMNEAESLGSADLIDRAGGYRMPEWWSYDQQHVVRETQWADYTVDGACETSVFHPTLQQLLLDAAAHAGVTGLRGWSLTSVTRDVGGFTVTVANGTASHQISAPYLIASDGRGSIVARQFGIQRFHDPVNHALIGLRISGHGLELGAAHEISLDPGYALLFPQQADHARLYVVTTSGIADSLRGGDANQAVIDLVSDRYPAGTVSAARAAGPRGIYPNADSWSDAHQVPGLLLIGDAASSNDPTQGHGVSLVLRDVRELRDAVIAHGLTEMTLAGLQPRIMQYRQTMRIVCRWITTLRWSVGVEADARRERFQLARASDPDAGGYNMMVALGPRDLVPDADAERRYFDGGLS